VIGRSGVANHISRCRDISKSIEVQFQVHSKFNSAFVAL
jgi:hypothetical protein